MTSLQPTAGNGERWSVRPPPCPPAELHLTHLTAFAIVALYLPGRIAFARVIFSC
jgi:hypothetical protein